MSRRLLYALSASIWGVSIAACCFPDENTKPAQQAKPANPPPAPPTIAPDDLKESAKSPTKKPGSNSAIIDRDEMYKNYLNNKAAVDAEFKGKIVEVVGEVFATGGNVDDGPYIVFQANPKGFVVSAWFDKKLDKEVRSLKKGQTIHIRGKVGKSVVMRRDGDVNFDVDNCTIVSVDGAPPASQKERDKGPIGPTVEQRKATYVRISTALTQVEASAIKKFGRKPTKEDNAGVHVPYNLFVERETKKLLDALANELKLPRVSLNAVKAEGDENSWPKK